MCWLRVYAWLRVATCSHSLWLRVNKKKSLGILQLFFNEIGNVERTVEIFHQLLNSFKAGFH